MRMNLLTSLVVTAGIACGAAASIFAQIPARGEARIGAPPAAPSAIDLRLPNKPGTVKFAVIGDTGTGDKHQLAVARQIVNYRSRFDFPFVIMVGDNIYGSDTASSYRKKFENSVQAAARRRRKVLRVARQP